MNPPGDRGNTSRAPRPSYRGSATSTAGCSLHLGSGSDCTLKPLGAKVQGPGSDRCHPKSIFAHRASFSLLLTHDCMRCTLAASIQIIGERRMNFKKSFLKLAVPFSMAFAFIMRKRSSQTRIPDESHIFQSYCQWHPCRSSSGNLFLGHTNFTSSSNFQGKFWIFASHFCN